MRPKKLSITSTFFSLLGYGNASPEAPQAERLEQLRVVMLDTLIDANCESHFRLTRKLQFAEDAQALWYARSELMEVLAGLHGEIHARQEIDQLNPLFAGLLPKALYPRQGGPAK